MLDFDNPIDDYEDQFRERHEQLVIETFDELLHQSAVDASLNEKTVAELREFQAKHGQGSASKKHWNILRIVVVIAAIGLGVYAFVQKGLALLALIPAVGLIVFLIQKINPEISQLKKALDELSVKISKKSDEAWQQMAPLNALYTWNLAPRLMQKTLPNFVFDRYFSTQRLNDLQTNYALAPEFNDGLSILGAQSGTFNDNPFVITRYKRHWMGERTYTGTLVISWTVQVRDANGNWVSQVRTQTLMASVVKPFPEYEHRSQLIYGHEAAPNLSFSRVPSQLSASNGHAANQKKIDRTVRKIERKSRKGIRTGNSDLTVMSNREFEALFSAINRTNEIEFRLLFTPLAQQEMVEILNDDSVGYGDDFSFSKYGKLNILEPTHLSNTKFEGDPRIFHSLELKAARQFFIDFHHEYFRSVYFAFAPLWTIPLYRDQRSQALGSSHTSGAACSNWENEVIANFIGETNFKHPESVTDNIVRAIARTDAHTTNLVDIVAYGYSGTQRVDFVPVLGGDGNIHSVPVPWTEYQPVSRQSTLITGVLRPSNIDAGEVDDESMRRTWESSLQSQGIPSSSVVLRNGIAAVHIQ